VVQVAPEAVLAPGVGSVEPVEPNAQLVVAAPARLVLRADHALYQRIPRAGVGAVGGIARGLEVDLVRDLEATHERIRSEAVDEAVGGGRRGGEEKRERGARLDSRRDPTASAEAGRARPASRRRAARRRAP